MSDLVGELRSKPRNKLTDAAANEIERLTAEVKRLTEQLRLTQIDWNEAAMENASLQAVVDAARDEVLMHPQIGPLGPCDCELCVAIRALDGEP